VRQDAQKVERPDACGRKGKLNLPLRRTNWCAIKGKRVWLYGARKNFFFTFNGAQIFGFTAHQFLRIWRTKSSL